MDDRLRGIPNLGRMCPACSECRVVKGWEGMMDYAYCMSCSWRGDP